MLDYLKQTLIHSTIHGLKGFQNLDQSKHFKFLYKMIETEKNFFTSELDD